MAAPLLSRRRSLLVASDATGSPGCLDADVPAAEEYFKWLIPGVLPRPRRRG
jgi:hypothetical protein